MENNTALLLSSNTEFAKINIYSGERVSGLREKNDGYTVRCLDYDNYIDKAIIGTSSKMLVVAGKGEAGNFSLNQHKIINFNEEISCIKINYTLKTIFFGGKNGTLFWCSYPLKLKPGGIDDQPGSYNINQ